MQLGNVTTDPAKDYGITFARQQYADGLPSDHPHKGITDPDYFMLRVGSMVDSWAQQADAVAPPPPPPPGTVNGIPQEVTRRQARTALALAGKLALVQGCIDAIPDAMQREVVQIEWDDSQTFQRQRPTLVALATGAAPYGLGMTLAELDALFVEAAKL